MDDKDRYAEIDRLINLAVRWSIVAMVGGAIGIVCEIFAYLGR